MGGRITELTGSTHTTVDLGKIWSATAIANSLPTERISHPLTTYEGFAMVATGLLNYPNCFLNGNSRPDDENLLAQGEAAPCFEVSSLLL